MDHNHAVVWLDHGEAHVIGFGPETHERQTVRTHHGHGHHRAGAGRPAADPAYFEAVADALTGAREVLVVGPASAKVEFVGWLEKHRPTQRKTVLGVESADHPSDGQLLDFARRWFRPVDAMRGDGS